MPSTVIRAFDYDAGARELSIQFVTGRCYAYFGVPPEEVEALRRARSKGGYFNRRIRDRFPYKRRQ